VSGEKAPGLQGEGGQGQDAVRRGGDGGGNVVRCKHLNCHITTVCEELMTIWVINGKVTGGEKYPGDILPPIYVQCKDCGKEWRYYWKNAPLWLCQYLEAAEREAI
jgi:hypothetical protein